MINIWLALREKLREKIVKIKNKFEMKNLGSQDLHLEPIESFVENGNYLLISGLWYFCSSENTFI